MTSISDRCKTAREGAAPGPWEVEHDQVFDSIVTETGCPVATDIDRNDSPITALAPEAADEVVRLTDALEDLLEWFDIQVMRASDLDSKETLLAAAAQAMIWKILNPNGDTND